MPAEKAFVLPIRLRMRKRKEASSPRRAYREGAEVRGRPRTNAAALRLPRPCGNTLLGGQRAAAQALSSRRVTQSIIARGMKGTEPASMAFAAPATLTRRFP